MNLFDYNFLSGISLRNRFVRSATNESMADVDSGMATPELIKVIDALAQGGVGMIISGHSYVSGEGQANSRKLAIDSDECIPGLNQLVKAAHHGGSAMIVQLAHAGAKAMDASGAIGPSPIAIKGDEQYCREMSTDDIKRIIEAFTAAAVRAQTAGFDGVQLHAAHGYLLSEFLSPYYNRRNDEYGGSISNRVRIIVEILKAVKDKCGKAYPVMIKINSEDFIPGGLNIDDSLEAVKILQSHGLNAVEVSGGTPDSIEGFDPIRKGLRSPEEEAFYETAARRFKAELNIPVILVGGIRSLETAQRLIDTKAADYIALSRPLIREPELIRRWQSGDTATATCISCNQCFRPIMTGRGMYCVIDKKANRAAE
ncbi:MAG: NADH:flavin oxidoreductase [Victivallales bacterium]|nr:NADH:flavin oxidoreductase [Victivallales bacterium]